MDLKVGKKVWVINKSEPTEVSIRFVGDREVAYEFDGKLETKKVKDLFETKEAAEAADKRRGAAPFGRSCPDRG